MPLRRHVGHDRLAAKGSRQAATGVARRGSGTGARGGGVVSAASARKILGRTITRIMYRWGDAETIHHRERTGFQVRDAEQSKSLLDGNFLIGLTSSQIPRSRIEPTMLRMTGY
jgi:hypothetical protein